MYFNVFFYALLLLSGLVLRLAPSLRGRHPIVLLLGLNLILIGVYFYRSVVYFLPPIGFALAGAVLVPAFLPRGTPGARGGTALFRIGQAHGAGFELSRRHLIRVVPLHGSPDRPD